VHGLLAVGIVGRVLLNGSSIKREEEECWRLAQYRDTWKALVNKVEKHLIQENAGMPSLTKFCSLFYKLDAGKFKLLTIKSTS